MNSLYSKIINFLFLIISIVIFSQKKIQTESYNVKGNCEMCKFRIEKAAKLNGVKSAIWNNETEKITLKYDPDKVSSDDVLKAIAKVGHDNEKYKTDKETYENLSECCHYDRELSEDETKIIQDTIPKLNVDISQNINENPIHNTNNKHSNINVKNIEEITLSHTKATTSLNKNEVGLQFQISSKELLKAACCNLSESFETNASVDVSYANAVTGTKQLRMLGLDQKYTLISKELMPEIRGLAHSVGLGFVPGRWIQNIQLTKGVGSVVNSFENMTGQINTEYLKYKDSIKTSINIFADVNERYETNLTHLSPLTNKLSQSILLHYNVTKGDTDHNNDGFLDRPKGEQYNLLYLLNFKDLEGSGLMSQTGIQSTMDNRLAGQLGFDPKKDRLLQNFYGVEINNKRFQIWNKTGYIFTNKPYQSLGWVNHFSQHNLESFFGNRNYFGNQKTWFSNLIFESIIGNTNHKYKTGLSFLLDQYNEQYLTQNFARVERVPALFFEYTFSTEKLSLVAGIRNDFHNLAGNQINPRLHLKYDFDNQNTLRASVGRAFRTANVFAENLAYFASNRELILENSQQNLYGLSPEIAWNYGLSYQTQLRIFDKKLNWVSDAFYTDFQNQVLSDFDDSPHKLLIYNVSKSSALSFQSQIDMEIIKNVGIRLAYKIYDVNAEYKTGEKKLPFVAQNRAFLNVAYSTKNLKKSYWTLDNTLQWIGNQRMPQTHFMTMENQNLENTPSYFIWNAQVSRQFSSYFRLYFGGENLLSYTQKNPIIDFKNPFGNQFDATMLYAPLMPVNFYIGLDLDF